MINAVAATLLLAVSATCSNRSARLVGGVEANFWRLIVSTGCLALYAFTLGSGLGGKALPLFVVSGVVGIGIGDFGLFESYPRLGARITMLLTLCLTSPIAMIMEWAWLGQGMSAREIACVALTLLGVGVTLWPDAKVPLPRRHRVTGTLYALLAALGGASGAVLSRRAYEVCSEHQEIIDAPTAAFQRVLGGLIVTALIFGALRLRPSARPGQSLKPHEKWRRLMPWVIGSAVSGLTLAGSFVQRALETTQAGIVLAIIATTPIAIIPLARIVEGEGISLKALAGAVVAVAGTAGLALVHHG